MAIMYSTSFTNENGDRVNRCFLEGGGFFDEVIHKNDDNTYTTTITYSDGTVKTFNDGPIGGTEADIDALSFIVPLGQTLAFAAVGTATFKFGPNLLKNGIKYASDDIIPALDDVLKNSINELSKLPANLRNNVEKVSDILKKQFGKVKEDYNPDENIYKSIEKAEKQLENLINNLPDNKKNFDEIGSFIPFFFPPLSDSGAYEDPIPPQPRYMTTSELNEKWGWLINSTPLNEPFKSSDTTYHLSDPFGSRPDNNGNPYNFVYENLDPDPNGAGKWVAVESVFGKDKGCPTLSNLMNLLKNFWKNLKDAMNDITGFGDPLILDLDFDGVELTPVDGSNFA